MIKELENAVSLAQLGYCAETIRAACPSVPAKLVQENARPKRSWRERKLPSGVFSASLDIKTLVKRQLSATVVMRYFEFRSTRRSFIFSGMGADDPIYKLHLDSKVYPKVSPENADTDIEIDLFTLARAYYTVLHGFLEADPSAFPTVNETLNLVIGIYTGEFFVIDCLCGRPVLVENKPSRYPDGEYQREFLTCPWCGKRNKWHNDHFERELEKFSNWVGNSEKYSGLAMRSANGEFIYE